MIIFIVFFGVGRCDLCCDCGLHELMDPDAPLELFPFEVLQAVFEVAEGDHNVDAVWTKDAIDLG